MKEDLAHEDEDYIDESHPFDFCMVRLAFLDDSCSTQSRLLIVPPPTPNTHQLFPKIETKPDVANFLVSEMLGPTATRVLSRLHALEFKTGVILSDKGQIIFKIRAPLKVLKHYAANNEYRLKLDERELQRRVEKGWPAQGVTPMLAINFDELGSSSFEEEPGLRLQDHKVAMLPQSCPDHCKFYHIKSHPSDLDQTLGNSGSRPASVLPPGNSNLKRSDLRCKPEPAGPKAPGEHSHTAARLAT